MSKRPCRWGILGTANIARKNWQAIRDAGNATLLAVASRDRLRAAAFIAECQDAVPIPTPPIALGRYEELITHPEIDAIYLPLPTALRKEWAIRAAEAGKAVLVEKPVGVTAGDVEEIMAACERNGVQFMDGVMFHHSGRTRDLRALLDDGAAVGGIRRISSQFSFMGDGAFLRTNIRTHSDLEPLGCLGDLGWYSVRFSLWALGYQMPGQVTGHIHAEAQQTSGVPVPTEFSGELLFAEGVSASFHCSFLAQNAEWAIVSGTNGYLFVPDFVLPFAKARPEYRLVQSEFVVKGCQFDMHEGRTAAFVEECTNNGPGSQEANLFHNFSQLVLSGKPDARWGQIAWKTQQVVDACLLSARKGGIPIPLPPDSTPSSPARKPVSRS